MSTLTALTRRIIPCLDVSDGKVVKGIRFQGHRVVGDIVDLALRYRDEGADELVLYDITASPDGRVVDPRWVTRVARVIDIPWCVAGGIDSVESARRVLYAGADKISVNSPALGRPELVSELAETFGSQCVVAGVDSIRTASGYRVRALTGRPDRTRDTGRDTVAWIRELQTRGAGEIVLNCMDQDGVRQGYDVPQLQEIRRICQVPLIASGGAGSPRHFVDVFQRATVDGALAASVFHDGIIAISDLKQTLQRAGIAVRPLSDPNPEETTR